MKKLCALTLIVLLSINAAFADRSKVYCKLDKYASDIVSLSSRVSFNGGTNLPDSFITGNDKTVTKDFTLGNNRVKFNLYFPKEQNGRGLNASTTVHVTIYLNGKEIVNTKHFGQPSDYYVSYNTDILCRSKLIYVVLDDTNNIRVRFMGVYIPKEVRENKNSWGEDDEKKFELDYKASSTVINDARLAKGVISRTTKTTDQQFSKTNNWRTDQFFLDLKQATWGAKNNIDETRKAWKNVPIPFLATYQGAELGDYFHLNFKDANGKRYDFGTGKNDYGSFKLFDENDYYKNIKSKYVGKTFKIFWEWKPSSFVCCEGGNKLVKAYQPSIVRLELVNSNTNSEDKNKGLNIAGTYECNKYDANEKNNWHYVTIEKSKYSNAYIWKNRANKSWTLLPTSDPLVYTVSKKCPYYSTYKTAEVVLDYRNKNKILGIWGPGKEFFTLK